MRYFHVVREHVRIAYARTEITVTDPELGEVAAADAAERYGPLWVITAHNPFSEKRSSAENEADHRRLVAELGDAGHELLPAVGASPDGRWSETSTAVIGLGRRRATKVGRTYGQNAVFEVTPSVQKVHGCFSTWVLARPACGPWEPAPFSDATLDEAIREAFGLELDLPFWRFRRPGWRYSGDPQIPCDLCGTDLDVFSALLQFKDGTWYDAKAIICQGCRTARIPSHLPAALRRAIYGWSDWHLTAQDALKHPTKGGEWHCYIAALDDPEGKRLWRDKEWVYVGQTGKDVDERFAEHKSGVRSNRFVRDFGTHLRGDLMADLPTHRTAAEALAYERYLAAQLELCGYGVKGGT